MRPTDSRSRRPRWPADRPAARGGAGGGDDQPPGRSSLRFLSLAWQKESVAANKQLVEEWNKANPDIQVEYVQGSWDNVHDQLLTSFEGGEAPDIIHDDSSASPTSPTAATSPTSPSCSPPS